ncbi:MAG TPA: J domain-containing protein [Terriglobia bacterium]|nr:J domain-containing protein [Terriglobia bacterium]
MNASNDLYIILDVARAASLNDIKRAFRRLARRYHPDINPGNRVAEERFKQISEAYEILSNPPKRRFYDEHGYYTEPDSVPDVSPTAAFRFQSFDFAGSMSVAPETFAEFFRSPVDRGPARGEDIEYPVSISFADSMSGLKARFTARRERHCRLCGGTGHESQAETACPDCGGEGRLPRVRGRLRFSANCATCAGTGRTRKSCAACGGEGRAPAMEIIEVELPAGVSSGARLKIDGKGNAGIRGGAPGDFYVIVSVTPHPTFNRAGDNIHCVIPIAFWEAALGAKIEVPTLDGRAILRIPPGTQNGQTLRLRGLGAPSLAHPGFRGDQLVTVRVVVPRIGDERSKAILRELARLNPENPRDEVF